MTLDESVDLIFNALEKGSSGETWIPILPSMRIGDLAEIFSEKHSKPIKIIGVRPGEKAHEDLINESESIRTSVLNGHYVIGPAYQAGNGNVFTYTSADDVMNKEQLLHHLQKLDIIDMPIEKFEGLKIEVILTKRN
jgi:FlaA1/EpsC-like NDP-sugar epimerase